MQKINSFWLVLGFSLLTCVPATSWADVYKQVDKDGNITYTDVPTKAKETPIKVDPMTTFKAPASKTSTTQSKTEKKSTTTYRSLVIQQPANDEVIRANNGAVSVTLQSQPGLDVAAGHKFAISLDGNILQSGQSGSLTINEVARGVHSISAQIVDANDKVLMSATPVSIQVLRASALAPARKK